MRSTASFVPMARSEARQSPKIQGVDQSTVPMHRGLAARMLSDSSSTQTRHLVRAEPIDTESDCKMLRWVSMGPVAVDVRTRCAQGVSLF